ncbi:hypothetical protein [Alteripontixanthobacter muriae]|nr:hypothetical protein [Alteripontixanthobacter muriae]
MRIFKSDLYRNFAIGFVGGALALSAQAGGALWEFVPHTLAAIF